MKPLLRRWAMALTATLLLSAACVPSTSDASPRGGVVIALEPSPGAAGAPIVTADGWTVTIDMCALLLFANASSDIDEGGGVFGKPQQTDILALASKPTTLLIYAIPEGPATAVIYYSVHLLGDPTDEAEAAMEGRNRGVDESVVKRFGVAADIPFDLSLPSNDLPSPSPSPTEPQFGPSLILVAHAEKPGHVPIQMNVSMQIVYPSDPFPTTVVRDALVNVPVTITPENLFRSEEDPRRAPLLFDDLANADANGDGVLSTQEIIDGKESCPDCSLAQAKFQTVASALSRRGGNIFVPTR